jgi:hypothetical protein
LLLGLREMYQSAIHIIRFAYILHNSDMEMKKKRTVVLSAVAICLFLTVANLGITAIQQTVKAQIHNQTKSFAPPAQGPVADYLDTIPKYSQFPLLPIFESPSILIMRFDEPEFTTGWNAIYDIKTHFGYSLNSVVTSGVGSQGNPTRFYVIMTK